MRTVRQADLGECVVDLAALARWDAETLAGKRVGLRNAYLSSWFANKKVKCPADKPCCSSTRGAMYVARDDLPPDRAGQLTLVDELSTPYVCTGTNCNPYAECRAPANTRVNVVGYVKELAQSEHEALTPYPGRFLSVILMEAAATP
jgi:hypothetical protein